MTSPDRNPARASRRNRKRALIAVVPLLAIAAFDLALILLWGLEPIWGFAILPPIVFVSALAWIYFGAVDGDDPEECEGDSPDPAR